MNQKQLKYVQTLAAEGSFSRAANTLHISQPSLSQYIKKLETEMNISLFDRRNGTVRLTDAGKVYLDTGRKILDLEHQMQRELLDISASQSGTISIGIADHRSVCLMPAVAAAFRKTHPGFRLFISEKTRNQLLDAAEHGEFDLCVTTRPVNEAMFHVEPLFYEEVLLAVPSDSALCRTLQQQEDAIDLALAGGADFVTLYEDHPMQHTLHAVCQEYGIHICPTVECTSLEAAVSMVAVGMGAALLPACLQSFTGKNVSFFHIQQPIPKREIVLIYRKDQHLSQAAEACIQTMRRVWN